MSKEAILTQLNWLQEGIHAKHFLQLLEGGLLPKTYRESLYELLERLDLDMPLQKMFKKAPLGVLQNDLDISDMQRQLIVLVLMKLGHRIQDIAGSVFHTPTTKANFTSDSMQKWPCCGAYQTLLGDLKITPELYEFLMGYPVGWTESTD